MEQRKIVESKNRDKEKIINTAVNEKKVGHSKIRLITKSTAFASSVNKPLRKIELSCKKVLLNRKFPETVP
jgi:hypothetical protein